MKRIKIITTIIILTNLVACAPPVTFNEPQPTDTDNLAEFPNRLQGQYLCSADSSALIIDAKTIQRIYDFDSLVSGKIVISSLKVMVYMHFRGK